MNPEKKHPNYETCLAMVEAGWNAHTESSWYQMPKPNGNIRVMTKTEFEYLCAYVSREGLALPTELCPAPDLEEILMELPEKIGIQVNGHLEAAELVLTKHYIRYEYNAYYYAFGFIIWEDQRKVEPAAQLWLSLKKEKPFILP